MNQMVLIPQSWAQNQVSHNQIAVMPQVDQQMEVRTVIQGERYTDLIKIGIYGNPVMGSSDKPTRVLKIVFRPRTRTTIRTRTRQNLKSQTVS